MSGKMQMLLLKIAIGLILTYGAVTVAYAPRGSSVTVIDSRYDKGFNDALMAISLLNLELDMKGERKTFGEMGDICRQRYSVKKSEQATGKRENINQ